MLKDYIKSLKKERLILKELSAESKLRLGIAYLEYRKADNTVQYSKMLEAVELFNKSTTRNIDVRVANLLEPIWNDLQAVWDSVEIGDE